LSYSFCFYNQTEPRRRDGGFGEGWIREGRIGEEEIGEGVKRIPVPVFIV
jgi:hypothetical protein